MDDAREGTMRSDTAASQKIVVRSDPNRGARRGLAATSEPLRIDRLTRVERRATYPPTASCDLTGAPPGVGPGGGAGRGDNIAGGFSPSDSQFTSLRGQIRSFAP
eukprot:1065286-Prorocentrum_minimum.AAC.3